MANLLSILRRRSEITRLSQQDYLAQLAAAPWYPGQSTLYSVGRRPVESVPNSYLGYAEAAYASCTVVGACMRVRRDIFSQARFTWRERTDDGTGPLSYDDGLDLLAHPWPNGTTGQLLTKMITDVDLCGNAYIVNEGDRLRWRRPDWMFVVLSGDPNVDDAVDVLGYVYTPGGCGLGEGRPYTVAEVAHWAPIPRPGSEYIGMSWMTSALREIQADKHATDHKLNFFVNGATLGPVFRLPATMTAEQFRKFRLANEEAHVGVENAYRPLYIGGGAEVTLSAATFQQLELKATQGAGESRIAATAGIHPAIAGFSEGLAGSSLNAGNFGAARRLVGDITLHKLWQDACDTLASFVEVPDGKELWIRERAIPFLREDAKDAAEIFAVDAQSATVLVREGYEPESVTPAVAQRNILLLKHSGALSVQLQEPGAQLPEQRSHVIDGEVVVRAIEAELTRRFDPSQPRDAEGRWTLTGAAVAALKALGGTSGALDLDPDDPEGRYFDWSSYDPKSHSYTFEAGGGGESVQLHLGEEDMTRLHNALSVTHLREDTGQQHSTAVAALLAAGAQDAVNFSDGGYADWSVRNTDGSYQFEIGDGDESVQMDLTPAELARLMASLALSTQPDEATRALVWALDEISRVDWNPAEHPRNPRGGPGGGRFRSVAARILDALEAWAHGEGDDDSVLAGFTQPQLRKAVQARGLTPKYRATAADLRKQLLDDVREKIKGRKEGLPRPATPKTPEGIDLAKLRALDGPEAIRDALDLHKVPELKEALREQKLALSGRKRELVDRLVEHIAPSGAGTPAAKKAAPKASRQLGLRHADAETMYEVLTGPKFGLAAGPEVGLIGRDRLVLSPGAVDRLRFGQPGQDGTIEEAAGGPAIWFFGDLLPLRGARARPTGSTDRPDKAAPKRDAPKSDTLHAIEEFGRRVEREQREREAAAIDTPAGREKRIAQSIHAIEVLQQGGIPDDNPGIRALRLRIQQDRDWIDAHRKSDAPKLALSLKQRAASFPHFGEPMTPDQARARQAEIDTKRKVADTLTEVAALVHAGADSDVLRRRITAAAQANGLDDATRDALLQAVGQARQVEVENKIRAAYRAVHERRGGDWVGLADLRSELGEGINRHEVDDVLRRLERQDGVNIVPESNQKALTQADRDSAVLIGDQAKHAITINDPSPRPNPLTETTQRLARDAGLTPVAEPGQVVPFDRKRHEATFGNPRVGEKVGVDEAGYSVRLSNGETVQLSKAKVSIYDPKLHGPAPSGAAGVTPPRPGARFGVLSAAERGQSGDGRINPDAPWGRYGAAGVLMAHTGEDGRPRYLLIKTGEWVDAAGRWQLPGGARDEHENPYQTVAREAVEEIGLSHDDLGQLAPAGEHVFEHPSGWQYTTLLADAPTRFEPKVDGSETTDARWFDADEIRTLIAEGKVQRELAGTLPQLLAATSARTDRPGLPDYTPPASLTAAEQDRAARLIRSDPQIFATLHERFGGISTSGNLSPEDAAWLQSVFEREPAFVNRLAQTEQIQRRLREQARKADLTPAAYRAQVAGRLKELLADKPVVVRVSDEAALRGILTEGRFRTQFDPGTKRASGLASDRERRRLGEEVAGIAPDTPADRRPVYGYVAVGGVEPALEAGKKIPGVAEREGQEDILSGYGKVQVVLKPGVRSRTTVTVGDSLDEIAFLRPTPIDAPTAESLGTRSLDSITAPGWTRRGYVEAQVHGGVRADDIAEVVFPAQPSAETVARLEAQGIPWRVLPATPEVARTPRKRAPKKAVRAAAGHDITPGHDEPVARSGEPDVLDLIIRTALDENLTQEDLDFFYEAMRHNEVARAAGADIAPGHDQLHHYWTVGPGRAKWETWRQLVAHLVKHVGLRKAKIFASRWFIETHGYAAGSDKNRVAHGKPPRGHRVGPG